jgi:hypothetical protein
VSRGFFGVAVTDRFLHRPPQTACAPHHRLASRSQNCMIDTGFLGRGQWRARGQRTGPRQLLCHTLRSAHGGGSQGRPTRLIPVCTCGESISAACKSDIVDACRRPPIGCWPRRTDVLADTSSLGRWPLAVGPHPASQRVHGIAAAERGCSDDNSAKATSGTRGCSPQCKRDHLSNESGGACGLQVAPVMRLPAGDPSTPACILGRRSRPSRSGRRFQGFGRDPGRSASSLLPRANLKAFPNATHAGVE